MFSTFKSTVNPPAQHIDLPTLKMSVQIPVYIFYPLLSSGRFFCFFFLVSIQKTKAFFILAKANVIGKAAR